MSTILASIARVINALIAYCRASPPTQIFKPSNMHRLVILGGSYAGISTAHRILKRASNIKVILVSPNTDVYWNMAVPRALVGVYGDEKVFREIAPGFERYGDRFEFIVGAAASLDVKSKSVGLAGGRTLEYDSLVLATGSRTKEVTPFKGFGSTEEMKEALKGFREQVKGAKTIVIAGGGPTGIEFAAEIKAEYGSEKEVCLIASGPGLSDESPASVQKQALKGLTTLDVQVKLNTRFKSKTTLPDGRIEVKLSDDSTMVADLYVPTYGLVPNSSYIPSEFLTDKGFVLVDECLRVRGAANVWAVGDVVDLEWKQFIWADQQSAYVAKNIIFMLSNDKAARVPYKVTNASGRILGFSLGPKAGTGAYGNWKMPGFVISWARKDLFTQNMKPMIDGTLF